MNNLAELIDQARDLTTSGTIFWVSIAALAVAWKALDVVARAQRKRKDK
jgi:hypothetical protein